jgi:hypothetical protein
VTDYIEIKDMAELSSLQLALSAKLKNKLKIMKRRIIGWPAGSFPGTVHFLRNDGNDVFWWLGDLKTNNNFFGHGMPADDKVSLNIDVQFNFPTNKFSRRYGGAFLRHADKIILAHRGIVTRGHGRIKKSVLFSERFATPRAVKTSSGEFLLVCELDSPSLIAEIGTFSKELRKFKAILKSKLS